MIFDMSKHVAALKKAMETGDDMAIAMEAAVIHSEGMAMERERVIQIIQRNRNVINPMQVVSEIRRPLR